MWKLKQVNVFQVPVTNKKIFFFPEEEQWLHKGRAQN